MTEVWHRAAKRRRVRWTVTDDTGPNPEPPVSIVETEREESELKKAVVVYRSHSGVTRRYAEEIGAFLQKQGVQASVASVGDCDFATLADADYVLLGCWTSGLFFILQHPDEPWLAFVRDMPETKRPRIGLFTTYKLATGSQFPKMRAALAGKTNVPELELKSRNGHLSPADEKAVGSFVSR